VRRTARSVRCVSECGCVWLTCFALLDSRWQPQRVTAQALRCRHSEARRDRRQHELGQQFERRVVSRSQLCTWIVCMRRRRRRESRDGGLVGVAHSDYRSGLLFRLLLLLLCSLLPVGAAVVATGCQRAPAMAIQLCGSTAGAATAVAGHLHPVCKESIARIAVVLREMH
jgi:hypothetical protein